MSDEDRDCLERRVRASTSAQRDVLRARIILLAAQSMSNERIVAELGCHRNTVSKWRRRFAKHGLRGLRDKPRSGRPSPFLPEQKARLLGKAIEWPFDNGFPFTHWDAKALQRLAINAGIFESIHPTTVWRWLRDADLQPHRTEYWLQSPDPLFEERMLDIVDLYMRTPDLTEAGSVVLSLDEKTSIQALQRTRPDLPMVRGIPQRIEYEYRRHGTLCLNTAFNVGTGEVTAWPTPNRPAPVFAEFADRLLQKASGAPEVHLVMDNLNTHWHHDFCHVVAEHSGLDYIPGDHPVGEDRRRFLASKEKRVVVHYTPKHASWLNQVEIWFSLLGRKVLARGSFASVQELEERLLAFVSYYNRILAHPYRWTYTGTPCAA